MQILGIILIIIFMVWVIGGAAAPIIKYLPSHEVIARRADRYWIEAGKPKGRDREFWFAAKSDLLEEHMFRKG
jgi:hypothetical protein